MSVKEIKRLFIIGNGFDIAHNLATAYSDFYEFLKKKNENHENKTVDNMISIINKHDKMNSGNKLWGELEEHCGKIALEEASILKEDIEFRDDEEKIHHCIDKKEIEKAKKFNEEVKRFPILFREWVETFNVEKDIKLNQQDNIKAKNREQVMKEFGKLFSEEDFAVLNFNYSDTIERIYKVKENKICHLHGCIGNKEKIYFGHGYLSPELSKVKSLRGGKNYTKYYEENGCTIFPDKEISDSLYKDTAEVIIKEKNFFNSLSSITDVYVYGFGFGKVDIPYIKKINQIVPHAEWHIQQYMKSSEGVEKEILSLLNFIDPIRMSKWKEMS